MQLLRLRPALGDADVAYVTVDERYREDLSGGRFYKVPEATRWDRLRLVSMVLRMVWIVVRERPDVIVSTGAAPGFVAIRMGKLVGARTVWVDSIANVDRLSMSGQRVRRHADLWLTQWPHLASSRGPLYAGAVI